MSLPNHEIPFRESLLGIPAAVNSYRAQHDLPPFDNRRTLNFNAFDRATHFVKAGIGDGELEQTVRPFGGQDLSDAVELVAQFPGIAEGATYIAPWMRDEEANKYLLGDHKYMGVAGVTIPTGLIARPILTAVVVMILANSWH
jgi:hypothetical protein